MLVSSQEVQALVQRKPAHLSFIPDDLIWRGDRPRILQLLLEEFQTSVFVKMQEMRLDRAWNKYAPSVVWGLELTFFSHWSDIDAMATRVLIPFRERMKDLHHRRNVDVRGLIDAALKLCRDSSTKPKFVRTVMPWLLELLHDFCPQVMDAEMQGFLRDALLHKVPPIRALTAEMFALTSYVSLARFGVAHHVLLQQQHVAASSRAFFDGVYRASEEMLKKAQEKEEDEEDRRKRWPTLLGVVLASLISSRVIEAKGLRLSVTEVAVLIQAAGHVYDDRVSVGGRAYIQSLLKDVRTMSTNVALPFNFRRDGQGGMYLKSPPPASSDSSASSAPPAPPACTPRSSTSGDASDDDEEETECPICNVEYGDGAEDTDKKLTLSCHTKHALCGACWAQMKKRGDFLCPFCRAPCPLD